jgi:hypothetical protein
MAETGFAMYAGNLPELAGRESTANFVILYNIKP